MAAFRLKFSAFLCATALFLAPAAYAQDPGLSAGQQPADYELRYELAQEVQQYRPMEDRVENILNVLAQELNEEDRERFRTDVTANLNMERLEGLAVATMAQLFTPEELRTMIQYYAMPESESISEKSPIYNQIVDTEISREIQTALNQLASAPPPPDVAEPPVVELPRVVLPPSQQQQEVQPRQGEAIQPDTQ